MSEISKEEQIERLRALDIAFKELNDMRIYADIDILSEEYPFHKFLDVLVVDVEVWTTELINKILHG